MKIAVEVDSEVFVMQFERTSEGCISRKAFADAVKILKAKHGKKARKVWYCAYEDHCLWYYAEKEKPRAWPRRYASLCKALGY